MGYYLDLISDARSTRPPRLDTLLRRAGAVRNPEGDKGEWVLHDDQGVYAILFVARSRKAGRLGSVRLSWAAGERELVSLMDFAEKLNLSVCDADTKFPLSPDTKDQFLAGIRDEMRHIKELGF